MPKPTIREANYSALDLANKPLSAKEIFEIINKNDFYRFRAIAPIDIVRTTLRRHCDGLDFPTAKSKKYFVQVTDGRYWRNDKPIHSAVDLSSVRKPYYSKSEDFTKELRKQHNSYLQAFKKEVLQQLQEIDPEDFENFCRKLLSVYGFKDVHVTQRGRDGGIDGHGKLKVGITFLNVAFQCKRWKATISRKEISSFRGDVQGAYQQGIFFTTSSFSKPAKDVENKPGAVPIILIDGPAIVDIMIEKKFGVEEEELPIYINAMDQVLSED